MNRYAYINDGIVWELTEADEKPDWPPTPEGEKPLFADIPEGEYIEVGFSYDIDTGVFTPYEGFVLPDARPHDEPAQEKTIEERLAEIEEIQMIQLEAQAEIVELLLGGEKQDG